jgi:hypothetical protein
VCTVPVVLSQYGRLFATPPRHPPPPPPPTGNVILLQGLSFPPPEIVALGWSSIRTFLAEASREGTVEAPGLTIVLVGGADPEVVQAFVLGATGRTPTPGEPLVLMFPLGCRRGRESPILFFGRGAHGATVPTFRACCLFAEPFRIWEG